MKNNNIPLNKKRTLYGLETLLSCFSAHITHSQKYFKLLNYIIASFFMLLLLSVVVVVLLPMILILQPFLLQITLFIFFFRLLSFLHSRVVFLHCSRYVEGGTKRRNHDRTASEPQDRSLALIIY